MRLFRHSAVSISTNCWMLSPQARSAVSQNRAILVRHWPRKFCLLDRIFSLLRPCLPHATVPCLSLNVRNLFYSIVGTHGDLSPMAPSSTRKKPLSKRKTTTPPKLPPDFFPLSPRPHPPPPSSLHFPFSLQRPSS